MEGHVGPAAPPRSSASMPTPCGAGGSSGSPVRCTESGRFRTGRVTGQNRPPTGAATTLPTNPSRKSFPTKPSGSNPKPATPPGTRLALSGPRQPRVARRAQAHTALPDGPRAGDQARRPGLPTLVMRRDCDVDQADSTLAPARRPPAGGLPTPIVHPAAGTARRARPAGRVRRVHPGRGRVAVGVRRRGRQRRHGQPRRGRLDPRQRRRGDRLRRHPDRGQHHRGQRLRPGRQRHRYPRRGQRRPSEGEPLRRRRRRHAHRRVGCRPALRPGRQRHPAGQARQRLPVRRRRQRRPHRRRRQRPVVRPGGQRPDGLEPRRRQRPERGRRRHRHRRGHRRQRLRNVHRHRQRRPASGSTASPRPRSSSTSARPRT